MFDYPAHNLVASSDSSEIVTVAPGSNAGLFRDMRTMEPRAYTPNEFFVSHFGSMKALCSIARMETSSPL